MDSENQFELSNQGDFVIMSFERGMHQIVEKIFLSLGLKTIQICKKVSQEWRGMLEFYLQNNIPRIRKIVARSMTIDPRVSYILYYILFI